MKVLHTVVVLSLLKWASCTGLFFERPDIRDLMEQWNSHNAGRGRRVKGSLVKGSEKNTYRECKDIPYNCASYKHLCEEKPQMMETLCYKTCGLCPEEMKEVDFIKSGGSAFASSIYRPGYLPKNAFDGSTYWHSGLYKSEKQYKVPQTLGVIFPEPIRVVKYSFSSRNDYADSYAIWDGPSKYIFWASNSDDCRDETQWEILNEDNSGTQFTESLTTKTEQIENSDFFRCYGFKITDVPGRPGLPDKVVTIGNVHFYSIQEVPEIQAVDFIKSGGSAFASSIYRPGYLPKNAFDGSTYWHSGLYKSQKQYKVPQTLGFIFPEPIRVVKYSFSSRNDYADSYAIWDGPSKYIFWGSNSDDCRDETQWEILNEDDSGTQFTKSLTTKTEQIENNDFFRCYGIKITDVPGRSDGNKVVTIGNVNFFTV